MSEDTSNGRILSLTARIVSAHVGHNAVTPDVLPALIQSVYRTLANVDTPQQSDKPQPAVPVRRSVFPDYIICLEDGKKLKMLKRHLMTSYSMTPEQYRERWGLPHDYPMVAPSYAQRRSTLAKQIGLGRKPQAAPPPSRGEAGTGGKSGAGRRGVTRVQGRVRRSQA
ncbi:MAG TPA: MucR family transcriptional regulator [Acetobacteraceae bacterium]|jgi:predicted transcriptional regulator|nr:MucR family transcriptional regulator [Acetobacteraceae bacterium]